MSAANVSRELEFRSCSKRYIGANPKSVLTFVRGEATKSQRGFLSLIRIVIRSPSTIQDRLCRRIVKESRRELDTSIRRKLLLSVTGEYLKDILLHVILSNSAYRMYRRISIGLVEGYYT